MLAVGSAFTQGSALLSTIVLARVLAPTTFGGWQQLLLLYGVVSPLLLAGLPAAITYFMARATDRDDHARLAFEALVALAAAGMVFAVVLLALRVPIADAFDNPALEEALPLYAPYALFAFIGAVMPSTLIPLGHAPRAAGLSAAAAAIFFACVVGAALAFQDLNAIAAAASTAGAVTAAISVVVVRRTIGMQFDRQEIGTRIRTLLAYGTPLALTGLAGVLGYQFDRIVVSAQFTPAEYAIYAIGAVEIPITLIVQQSTNSVLLPALARSYRDGSLAELGDIWRDAIRKTSLVLLPLFALCLVVAGPLIEGLFGARYSESADIFRVYLLLMPLRVATYGLIPMAIGRTRINLAASIITLVANAVLAIALVEPLGLKGPALATVIAVALTVAYYLVRLRTVLDVPLGVLFPWRTVGTNLVLSLLVAVPIVPLLFSRLPDLAVVALASSLYAVLYVALMRATRRIRDDDWRRLVATARGAWLRVRPGAHA